MELAETLILRADCQKCLKQPKIQEGQICRG